VSVKEDWGHSSNVVGVELCQLANVKHLVLFHHETRHNDERIAQIWRDTLRYEEISRTGEALRNLGRLRRPGDRALSDRSSAGCQRRRRALRIGVDRGNKSLWGDVKFTRAWSRSGPACAAPGTDSMAGHAVVGAMRLAWLDGYQELSPARGARRLRLSLPSTRQVWTDSVNGRGRAH